MILRKKVLKMKLKTDNPKIIGTGGVLTGRDAFEHILCGASMVQVGTTLHKEGVAAFNHHLRTQDYYGRKRL